MRNSFQHGAPKARVPTVVVTGASGTLGYNLVRHLALTRPDCRLVALMRTPDEGLFGDLPQVEVELACMQDTEKLTAVVRTLQPDAIVHCAASGVRPSSIGWFEQVKVNVSATNVLFEASCDVPDCHFIHVSTGLVYSPQDRPCREGDPIDTLHPYGATKAAADCLLRAGADRLQRAVTVVRPFSFTGLHDAGDRLFPAVLRAAQEGRSLPMSAGSQIRDFCAVQDVVDGIAMVLKRKPAAGCTVINLGCGEARSLRDIVLSVCEQMELKVDLAFGAAAFHPYEPMHMVADIDNARSMGWKPRTNLAYAVWELARSKFQSLHVRQPEQYR